jgi:TolA-binding protein
VSLARIKLEQRAADRRETHGKGQPQPARRMPAIPASAVTPRSMEMLAEQCYSRLIEAAPESDLAARARIELSENLARQGRRSEAAAVLSEGIGKVQERELFDRIRIRLAALSLEGGSPDAAVVHLRHTTNSPNASIAAGARYLLGEAFAAQGDWDSVVAQLAPFRDNGNLQRIGGVSDRALVRLAQAYGQKEQWDLCRGAYEAALQRFRSGPWLDEAHYGIGWTWQQAGHLDKAIESYLKVARTSLSQWAAKAQIQIGRCYALKKEFVTAANELLAVDYTYDYPDWTAAALGEAAAAYMATGQVQAAAGIWQRLVAEHADSAQAESARSRLAALRAQTESATKESSR